MGENTFNAAYVSEAAHSFQHSRKTGLVYTDPPKLMEYRDIQLPAARQSHSKYCEAIHSRAIS